MISIKKIALIIFLGVLLTFSLIGNALLVKQNNSFKETMSNQSQQIEQLNKEVNNNEDIIEKQNKDIEKLNKQMKEKNETIKNLNKEINSLKEKNKELRRSTTLNRGVSSNNYNKKANFVSTFYFPLAADATSMEHDGDASRTASGRPPGPTVFAVDPTVIPLGSKMRVTYPNGEVRVGVAGDTGGAIKGYKIDTFVWTSQEGNRRGRENVVIEWATN